MPEPMAKALGWPDTPIGWADVLALAQDPQGWASKGHPEWGRFTLGKTNPDVSTSGLAATIGTLVAATGTSSDLTEAALERPEVQQYLKDVESSVIHYGDTTLTYLSNLQRADDAGAALGYLSAVAVEEKSVLDYNAGNPDRGPRHAGRARAAEGPAGRGLPQGGHALQRQPVRHPGRALVDRGEEGRRAGLPGLPAAARAAEGVHRQLLPDRRRRAGRADHRQPLPDRRRRDDRAEPAGPEVLRRRPGALGRGPQERQGAGADGRLRLDGRRLRLRRQVQARPGQDRRHHRTGSAGRHRSGRLLGLHHRPADADHHHRGPGRRRAAGPDPTTDHRRDRRAHPAERDAAVCGDQAGGRADERPVRTRRRSTPSWCSPTAATSTPTTTWTACSASWRQAPQENGVRVFTIAYGPDADLETLQQISEASRAAAYDARNPATIDKVFANVLSNF